MDRRSLLRLSWSIPALGIANLVRPAIAHAMEPMRLPGHKPLAPQTVASRRKRIVMIDAGHGGHDPGAIGLRGTYEKHVVLDIAHDVARRLAPLADVQPLMTRDTDIFLPLEERVARAREAKADFFISIHADSAPDHDARGLSAYSLSHHASDAFAGAIAKTENSVDGPLAPKVPDPAVAAILNDLMLRHTREASLRARAAIVEGAGRDGIRLLDNPMRSANFAVLRAPDVPSVLVETGFLSNGHDEDLLDDDKVRAHIAGALAQQIGHLMTTAAFT